MRGNDFRDDCLDRSSIGDLLKPSRFDHLIGTTLARPHGFEYLFGNLAGDRIVLDSIEQAGKLAGRNLTA